MTDKAKTDVEAQADPKTAERKYYTLDPDFSTDSAPVPKWLNIEEQTKGLRPDANKPFGGFQFSARPQFKFDRKGHRGPFEDATPMTLGIWFVSERLKTLFEQLDPEAFVFQKVDIDYSNFPEPGPDYWFCYIMRVLDCVDEEHSEIVYQPKITWKVYKGLIDLKMKPEIVGSAHAFRLKYASLRSIVDDLVVDALNQKHIRGFTFKPIQQ